MWTILIGAFYSFDKSPPAGFEMKRVLTWFKTYHVCCPVHVCVSCFKVFRNISPLTCCLPLSVTSDLLSSVLLHAYICLCVSLRACLFFQELQLFLSSPWARRSPHSTRVQTVETPVAPNCANLITHPSPPHTPHCFHFMWLSECVETVLLYVTPDVYCHQYVQQTFSGVINSSDVHVHDLWPVLN